MCATTWLRVKNMILSERSKTQKAMYPKIPFPGDVKKKTNPQRQETGGCQSVGRKKLTAEWVRGFLW